MSSSGYEHGDSYRLNAELMDSHFQRILYKDWFRQELGRVLGDVDIRKVRLWNGPCGCYWLRDNITVVFTYGAQVYRLEQADVGGPAGIIKPALS